MAKSISKVEFFQLVAILSIFVLARVFFISFLNVVSFGDKSILILELLNNPVILPGWVFPLFGIGNLFLIYIIGNKLEKNLGLFAAILYALSSWSIYLDMSGSIFVFLTFLLLLFFFGLQLLEKDKLTAKVVITIVSILLIYTNILMVIILPILLICKISGYKIDNKIIITIILSLLLPLFLSFNNFAGIKNILNNNVGIFQEVGLINGVNTLQGQTRESGYGLLARLVENRYFYLGDFFVLTVLKNISLGTYFSPQEKILGFSFSAPLFIGFLVPFLMGLSKFFKNPNKLGFFAIVFLLLLPSVLARRSPDLEKLLIISPFFFFMIAYGLTDVRKKMSVVIILFLVVIVVIQGVTTITDIATREPQRAHIFKE